MKKLTNRSYFKKSIRKGFTLIEIVLAVAILSLLAVIIIPNFFGYVTGAKKASDEVSLSSLNNATALYAASEGKSTTEVFADASTDSLKISALVNKGVIYLPHWIPTRQTRRTHLIPTREAGHYLHITGPVKIPKTICFTKVILVRWQISRFLKEPGRSWTESCPLQNQAKTGRFSREPAEQIMIFS